MLTKKPTKTYLAAPILGALALAGCNQRNLSVTEPIGASEAFALTAEWPAFTPLPSPDAKVDILFMVDNSLSMKPLQAKLASGFNQLMTVLENLPGGTPDLHIGVVSSDMGAGIYDESQIPACRKGGDGGHLQFMPRGTCTGPSDAYIALRTDPVSHQLVTNYGAQPLPDVFACIARIGDTGCGFEQQLSSVRHALDPALAPAGNAGFLRDDAFLAVILVTNEDDCSIPADSTLFDPQSRLVSDPLGPLASYRCNEYGHVCRIDGTLQHPPRTAAGPLAECQSAEDGKLDKVGDFVTFLKGLKGDPARVFLAAVTGPATPYVVSASMAVLPDDPSPWPQIDHSCIAADGTYADPSVRIAQTVKAFGSHGLLSSICDDTMGPVLHEISTRFSRPLAPSCVPTPDPAGPGCTVIDRWIDDAGARAARRLPSCADAGAAAPCWKLVDDTATCGATARRLEVDRSGSAPPATLMTAIDCTAAHP
jgi:hypothetical protein